MKKALFVFLFLSLGGWTRGALTNVGPYQTTANLPDLTNYANIRIGTNTSGVARYKAGAILTNDATTDLLPEGSTNKYASDANILNYLSGLSYGTIVAGPNVEITGNPTNRLWGTGDLTISATSTGAVAVTPYWSNVLDKPTLFDPSTHSHPGTQVTSIVTSATYAGTATNLLNPLTTDNVTEANNMYYTWARVAAMYNSNIVNIAYPPYNCVGDGSTDCTTGLNSALATLKALYFPPGVYKVVAPIYFTNAYQHILGEGKASLYYGGTSNVAKAFIWQPNPLGYGASRTFLAGVRIDGVNFIGSTNVTDLVFFDGVAHSSINNSYLINCNGAQLTLNSNVLVRAKNIKMSYGELGLASAMKPNLNLKLFESWACFIDNPICEYSTNGVYMDHSVANTWVGGTIEAVTTNALVITNNCFNNNFYGLEVENVGGTPGISILDQSWRNNFIGGLFGTRFYVNAPMNSIIGAQVRHIETGSWAFNSSFRDCLIGMAPYSTNDMITGYLDRIEILGCITMLNAAGNAFNYDPLTNVLQNLQVTGWTKPGYINGNLSVHGDITTGAATITNSLYLKEHILPSNVSYAGTPAYPFYDGYFNNLHTGPLFANYGIFTNGVYATGSMTLNGVSVSMPGHTQGASTITNGAFPGSYTVTGTLGVGGGLTAQDIIYHYSNLRVVNKATNDWITWATKNISGSEAVIDLSNIGTINGSSMLSSTTGTDYVPYWTGSAFASSPFKRRAANEVDLESSAGGYLHSRLSSTYKPLTIAATTTEIMSSTTGGFLGYDGSKLSVRNAAADLGSTSYPFKNAYLTGDTITSNLTAKATIFFTNSFNGDAGAYEVKLGYQGSGSASPATAIGGKSTKGFLGISVGGTNYYIPLCN
jgi:hypothetical protein